MGEVAVMIKKDRLESLLAQSDQVIRESCLSIRKHSLLIGWEGQFIADQEGWKVLGYANGREYAKSLGLGKSTFYKMIHLAERFRGGIKKEEFLSMTIENAALLSNYPEEVRFDHLRIENAGRMGHREFMESLRGYGNPKLFQPKERGLLILPSKGRKVVEQWQLEHGVESREEALVMLLGEIAERPTLIGFMVEWQERLKAAISTASATEEDLKDLRELFKIYVSDMEEILSLCAGKDKKNG
jgi:hypothetical protein